MKDSDYFIAERKLIEYLKTAAQASGSAERIHILSESDLEGLDEERVPTPAVCVLFGGDTLLDQQGTGGSDRIEQSFWVVAATRDIRDPVEQRKKCAPLVMLMYRAVRGNSVGLPNFKKFRRAKRPARQWTTKQGRFYFGLLFSIEMVV